VPFSFQVSWQRRLRFTAALVGIVALGPVVSLVGGIGPPWPHEWGIAALCMLANAAAVLFAYRHASSDASRAGLQRSTRRWLGAFAGSLVLFIVLKSFFCYNAPSFRYQVAGGFVLQADMKEFLRDDPAATVESLLEDALYSPTMVWEPWSVYLVQVAILVCWVALFASLSFPLAGALFSRGGPSGPDEAPPHRS
jgi:hypothetical protein